MEIDKTIEPGAAVAPGFISPEILDIVEISNNIPAPEETKGNEGSAHYPEPEKNKTFTVGDFPEFEAVVKKAIPKSDAKKDKKVVAVLEIPKVVIEPKAKAVKLENGVYGFRLPADEAAHIDEIIRQRIDAGMDDSKAHFIKKCVDFAINFNIMTAKNGDYTFAIPDEMQTEFILKNGYYDNI